MSDLSAEERPQPPRAPRATRPKTRASTPRRATKPAAAFNGAQSDSEPTPAQEKAAAAGISRETALDAAVSPLEREALAGGARGTVQIRGLTIISKEILLWGGIAGVGNFAFSLLALLIFNVVTINGVLQGVYCLSFLVPPALAFFAGLRATAREGNARKGAVAGIWSLLFFEVLGLVYSVIALTVINNLKILADSAYWVQFMFDFLFAALIAFGAGYFGGWFSDRRRKQAGQKKELLTPLS